MLEAYFDESYRENRGVFCVAGYCYVPKKARRLEREWRKILGGRRFHAKEMHHKQGAFKDLSQDAVNQMYANQVSALVRNRKFGVAVSIDISSISTRWPQFDGLRTAYAYCCTMAVTNLVNHLDSLGLTAPVAYTFEAGHKHQSEANRFMQWISQRRGSWHYLSHDFVAKEEKVLLETADLLVWEWGKYVSEVSQKIATKKDPMRKSMDALLAGGPSRNIMTHQSSEEAELNLTQLGESIESILATVCGPPLTT